MLLLKKGFTLIELMVVLVIMGIIAGVVAPNILDLTDYSIDSEAKKIAILMQSLYNKAIIKNVFYVAKFDLDNKKYFIFKCEDAKSSDLMTDEERKKNEEKLLEKKKRLESGELQNEDIDLRVGKEGETDELNIGSDCKKDDEMDVTEHSLPEEVSFKGIKVEYRDKLTEQGSEYLVFFPSGQMTKAMIYLQGTNESTAAIEFHPLLGTYNLYDYLKDLENEDK